MTLLEYVCQKLLGPPAKAGGSAGETYWCCPFHGDDRPSFHTLPHKPQFKDRWKCFGCGQRGDLADLLRHFYPKETYTERLGRLEKLRGEFENERGADQKVAILLRGPGSMSTRNDDPREVAAAWADLNEEERNVLIEAQRVLKRIGRDVSFEGLSDYCFYAAEWFKEMDLVEALMREEDERRLAAATKKTAGNKGKEKRK